MSDSLLAQPAIDRRQSAAHELVLEGESYRCRQRPDLTTTSDPTLDSPANPTSIITPPSLRTPKWSHATSETVVPSRWQAPAE
jgi:hypothetical protein